MGFELVGLVLQVGPGLVLQVVGFVPSAFGDIFGFVLDVVGRCIDGDARAWRALVRRDEAVGSGAAQELVADVLARGAQAALADLADFEHAAAAARGGHKEGG